MTAATLTAKDLKPGQKAYQPYGSAETLFYCKDKEVVMSGPAGTGKSRGCLEKLNLCALKYPGMRGLIVRKTRASLTESALVTFEDKVLPDSSPVLTNIQRKMRQAYRYPNGSEIIVGGMDDPKKVMSTEYDLIYVQEAIELTENDWESLKTRLRNYKMPYQQIISDTNPDAPAHWLKQRADNGATTMIECRHEDNPVLYDPKKKDWTPIGKDYIENTLDSLTGPRKLRLRYGKWVQAEGVVYESFDRAIHVINRFDIPAGWPRYWVVDFGFTNPFCWQAWATDPDGRLYRYREIYMTKRRVEEHARTILKTTEGEPRPQAVICDHDAEDRATLAFHLGMGNTAADKAVSVGIQEVQSRLALAGDGKPRVYFLRDSLVERDLGLAETKKPACTEDEFDGYIWDTSAGRKKGEEPLKMNDHGMDAMRYVCMFLNESRATGNIRRLW